MRQICHSLGEAHEQNMIHRDIKPANIYICRMGPDYDFVKVLDFGLVKSTEPMEAASAQLTAEGVATGTPAFMAPEMAVGKSEIDGRADLYALGCVGYWLVTGQLVFEAENALAAIVAHVQDPPIPPSQRTELPIPSELERLLLACLEKEPERRPQSAAELDAWLARIPVAEAWDADAARKWWELHIPEADLSAAELLDEETDHHNILAAGA
jgi:serine/threonine-protein kinase